MISKTIGIFHALLLRIRFWTKRLVKETMGWIISKNREETRQENKRWDRKKWKDFLESRAFPVIELQKLLC